MYLMYLTAQIQKKKEKYKIIRNVVGRVTKKRRDFTKKNVADHAVSIVPGSRMR